MDPAQGEPIDVLIGNNFLCEIMNFASQLMVQPGLYLLESDFGWVIAGRMDQPRTQSKTALLTITRTLESLWPLDTLGIREPNLSEEEEEEEIA